ncbi:hypothetical protein PV325_007206 [Microctonus aethiopoides]|nr:hypothetical protein PV325_007206 [Microctonus aethiopoides]
MDVGDLSNAAAVAGSGTNFTINNNTITSTANIINNNNTPNIYANAGWWTPNSTIVTAPSNADVMNQLCRVCGEPAAGFHFGAFTCEGCKSFFGRTYNNLGSITECKNGSACVINKKNRTACKACRLRKCLRVGMSKSGSRYGRRSNWFKIHCLLQEQSHQVQSLMKDANKTPYDKVLNSLDAVNNNNSSNYVAAAVAASATNSSAIHHGRLMKNEDPRTQSPRLPIVRPDILSHHDLLRPEVTNFPMWRTPPFFHPSLNHMQLLNAPFFPFPHHQRFVVPYVNHIEPTMPITSLTSSSSESVSPRTTPSPKRHCDDINLKENNNPEISDKSVAFFNSLGPEQVEPMDLSKKSIDISDRDNENNTPNSDEILDDVKSGIVNDDFDSEICGSDIGPPLDLTWKT